MTADDLMQAVVGPIAVFLATVPIWLLGFTLLRMMGGK